MYGGWRRRLGWQGRETASLTSRPCCRTEHLESVVASRVAAHRPAPSELRSASRNHLFFDCPGTGWRDSKSDKDGRSTASVAGLSWGSSDQAQSLVAGLPTRTPETQTTDHGPQ